MYTRYRKAAADDDGEITGDVDSDLDDTDTDPDDDDDEGKDDKDNDDQTDGVGDDTHPPSSPFVPDPEPV